MFWTVWLDVALMLPAVYVFLYLQDWIRPVFTPEATITHGICYYGLLGIAFMAVMYVIAVFQYRSTYTCVYDESANRRISLAEKLRKLPLAFFGEKNLSDLTATIMDDCTELEHTFSHAVPQLIASLLSILLITIGMAFYDWALTLALFLGGPHFLGRNRPLQKKTAQAEPNELPEQKGSDRTNTGKDWTRFRKSSPITKKRLT